MGGPGAEAARGGAYSLVTAQVEKFRGTARLLGRAGLIPFFAAGLVIWSQPQHAAIAAGAQADYAFAIASFLLGAWWGLALIRRETSILVLSNCVFLLLFFARLWLPEAGFLVAAAAVITLTVLVERRHRLFRRQPPYYARLRLELTLAASSALLVSAALL